MSHASLRNAVACWLGLGSMGASCSIYAPTLNHTPLVSRRGDAELGIAARALTQAEIFAAYSPLKHLVMTGGVENLWDLPSGDRQTSATQGDAGLGVYTSFGNDRGYAGAIGGYGKARSANRYSVPGSPLKDYRARYERIYGQGYAAVKAGPGTLGVALRLTRLRFNELTFNGGSVLEKMADRYMAPSVFLRGGSNRIQWQVHYGASYPQGEDRSTDSNVTATESVVGFSVAMTPHLFGPRVPH